MFLSGEAFLLGSCNDFAVNQQSCSAIMVVSRYAEDIHKKLVPAPNIACGSVGDLFWRYDYGVAAKSMRKILLAAPLLIFALAPGQSSKFSALEIEKECKIEDSNFWKINIKSAKLISPPDNIGHSRTSALSTYFTRQEVLPNPPKSIWYPLTRPRFYTQWHSPAFYWIEQKSNSLLGLSPESQTSPLSKAINHGRSEYSRFLKLSVGSRDTLRGYSGWEERFPLTIVNIDLQDGQQYCRYQDWIRSFKVIQRGAFLGWSQQWGIRFETPSSLAKSFISSANLSNKGRPHKSTKSYMYIGLSTFDLPLWSRLLICIIAILLVLTEKSIRQLLSEKPNDTLPRKAGKLIIVNSLILVIILGGVGIVIETLLGLTRALDEYNSRKPSYYPLRDSLVHEHNLRAKMLNTNEYGFVDLDVNTYDKNEKCKIAVLGDSFVWGSGFAVGSDQRWTSQLQKLIPNCRILHWGIPGWGPVEQEEFMRTKGNRHVVDLIIIGVVTNDYPTDVNEDIHSSRTNALIRSIGQTPIAVVLTPWSGLAEHHEYAFSLASSIYKKNGIIVKSCLPDVQALVGNAALPRSMWATSLEQPTKIDKNAKELGQNDPGRSVAVDRHPGMPVTLEIAKCTHALVKELADKKPLLESLQ